jgi:hypothetical protein
MNKGMSTMPPDGTVTILKCGHGFGFSWLRNHWKGNDVRKCPKCGDVDTEPLYGIV